MMPLQWWCLFGDHWSCLFGDAASLVMLPLQWWCLFWWWCLFGDDGIWWLFSYDVFLVMMPFWQWYLFVNGVTYAMRSLWGWCCFSNDRSLPMIPLWGWFSPSALLYHIPVSQRKYIQFVNDMGTKLSKCTKILSFLCFLKCIYGYPLKYMIEGLASSLKEVLLYCTYVDMCWPIVE